MTFPKNAHKFSPVIAEPCRDELVALLRKRPHSIKELSKLLNRSEKRVSVLLRGMRGSVYIDSWVKEGTGIAAVWAYGAGEHAPKPVVPNKAVVGRLIKRLDEEYLVKPYFPDRPRFWGGL